LHNRGLRIIGGGAEYVQQESRGRILKISIQPLGDGDEPDAVLLPAS
jgi:hypothetical protein